MKPKILIADTIHDKAIEEAKIFADVVTDFDITPEELQEEIPKYDAIIVRSRTRVTGDLMKKGNLKAIARAGVGLDNIDLETAKDKNIEVINAPESLTISVAEHTIGLMLGIARHIPKADKSIKEGRWEKKKFIGIELYGKTLGIIGFGRIGREVAQRGYSMGMKILVYDPYITTEDTRENNAEKVELDELLEQSDFVSLHLPVTSETKGLINKDKLSKMKKTAFLINTARGAIVNEKELISALEGGMIRGAALDVYENEPLGESPLTEMDNVVLTPHISSGTEDAQRVAGMIVVERLQEFFGKKQ